MILERAMVEFLIKFLLVVRSKLKSRASLEAENLVLRHQVIVLSRKSQSRVWLISIDRLIFVWLYRLFPSILNTITVVKPETVIRWHRRGFRAYWRWKSRRCGGRPRINREIRDLIRWMNKENPLWGAPRIHSELLMLGIEVSLSAVAIAQAPATRPDSPVTRIARDARCAPDTPITRLKFDASPSLAPSTAARNAFASGPIDIFGMEAATARMIRAWDLSAALNPPATASD